MSARAPMFAVFGGSFDPPHVAHVLVAAWAHASAGVDRVLVVPAAAHAFGKTSAPFRDRVAMCRLAFAGLDFVTIEPLEGDLAREGQPLYTLEVLRELGRRHEGASLRLVIGADVLADTPRWHRWEEVSALAPPLVVGRGGHPLPPECPFAMPEISSTEVRARLARGDSAHALLSPAVRDYAQARGLYDDSRSTRLRAAVIGRGRVGHGLAAAATRAEVILVDGHTPHDLDVDLVIVAVADAAIADVAERFDAHVASHVPFVHCAGALGPDALQGLTRPYGAMHPLASFASARRPPALVGTTFAINGSPEACAAASLFARACGAHPMTRAVHGGTYHAAAALVANGAAGLATVAASLLAQVGLSSEEAERALGALLRTVAENVAEVGVPDALTGPVRRGDEGTVRAHRHALASDAAALGAYDAIAPVVLQTAATLGLPPEKVAAVRAALSAPVS